MPNIAPPLANIVTVPDPVPLSFSLDPEWVVLPEALLNDGVQPVTIDAVLLHPARGVVLLEAPPRWTPDAPARLERCLAQSRFRADFPGHLPVVHASLPRGAMLSLPMLLASGFEAQPPLDLPGHGEWLEAAQSALQATPGEDAAPPPPGRARSTLLRFGGLALASSLIGALLVHQLAAPDVAEPAAEAVPEAALDRPLGAGPATLRLAGMVSPSAQAMLRPAALQRTTPDPAAAATEEAAAPEEAEAVDASPLPPPGPPVLASAPPALPGAPGAPAAPVVLRDLPALALAPDAALPGLVAVIGAPPAALQEFVALTPPLLPAAPVEPQRLAAVATGEAAPPMLAGDEAAPAASDAVAPAVLPHDAQAEAPGGDASFEAGADAAPAMAAGGSPAAAIQPVVAPTAVPVAAPTVAPVVAVVAAPVAASLPAARTAVDQARLGALLRRGDALLALGDVSGARRFYERAAEEGSAEGARAAGRTHDPVVLAGLGARGIRPDPTAAAAWYRRADALAAEARR